MQNSQKKHKQPKNFQVIKKRILFFYSDRPAFCGKLGQLYLGRFQQLKS